MSAVPVEIIPARMLNEVAYCPRLFALEHVMGDWADSADTVEGRTVHRRVDRPTTAVLPEPGEEEDPERPRAVRSVRLSDPGLGFVAVIDLVEVKGDLVVPVDYKKSKAPDVPEGAWEPERVQVCAQALLLRAHGYRVEHAVLYFAGSRTRVIVAIDEALVAATLRWADQARSIIASQRLPAPLVSSPKCRGCSLVGICLPDEHHAALTGDPVARNLTPARDDTIPLHVKLRGGRIGLDGGEIAVKDTTGSIVARVRIAETSQVVLHGNVTMTTPLLHRLAGQDIPVALHSYGGWYQGSFHPATGRNVPLRHAQHLAAADPEATLALSKAFVEAKIRNQRTMLRRNARGIDRRVLDLLDDSVRQVPKATDLDVLRGVEGNAARMYFESLPLMLKGDLTEGFDFQGRNRRPPRDPINVCLSFAYAMLARDLTHVAHRVGLVPYVGYLHAIRHNKPALALDLMEEMRPVLADSAVISAVNNGVVKPDDFIVTPVGATFRDAGKKRFIRAVERRLDELVTHPFFGTRWSYRRTLEVQARLLGKVLLGELDTYPGFTVR